MHIGDSRRREKGTEEVFESITTETFLKLMVDAKPQVQEAHSTLSKINIKNLHQGISYSNFRKIKDRGSHEISQKVGKLTNRGTRIGITLDFSSETIQARRDWRKYLQH